MLTGRLALRRFTSGDAANLLSLTQVAIPASPASATAAPQRLGRGYATEGARALVRLAFTGLGVREVVATTMVNTGSRRVMEKAGLRYTRTVHLDWPEPLDGNEHGDVEYRPLREHWLELCATTALQPARRGTPASPGSAKSSRHHGPGLLLDLR